MVASSNDGDPDYEGAAVELIESDIADRPDIGRLSASCEGATDSLEVGDEFACTAETSDGDTIEFLATVAKGDRVTVDSTNLITADGLDRIETTAVTLLETEVGQPLGTENLDCGDGPIVFDPSAEVLACELTDPETGNRFDTTIELSGLDADDALEVTVGEQIA